MATPDTTQHRLGTVLVALQLALIVFLAVIGVPEFLSGRAPLLAWVMAAAGVLLGLWALSCNRPGNLNIRPAPREGGRLVQEGPYRWIRPAVIACGLACALAATSPWGWLGVAALVAVLATKATLEERWMLAAHPGYAGYRALTRRFVPVIF